MPLEPWVFIAIFGLAGFLIFVCGINQSGLNLAFTVAGIATASFSSLILNNRFKRWLEAI